MFKDYTLQEELIESYLSGKMTGAEREKFEALLTANDNLREQVKLHQLTIAALQEHGRRGDAVLADALQSMTRDELDALLQRERAQQCDGATCVAKNDDEVTSSRLSEREESPASSAEVIRKKLSRRHRRSAWWPVVAAVALVTGVWFGARSYYLHKMAHRAYQKVSDTYIVMRESGEKADASRGDNDVFMQRHNELTDTLDIAQVAPTPDSIEVVMQQAMSAMRNGMTVEAIGLLEPLYQQSGMNKEVGIALAMAYVKAQKRDKAINTLNAMNQHYDGDPEIEELLKILVD